MTQSTLLPELYVVQYMNVFACISEVLMDMSFSCYWNMTFFPLQATLQASLVHHANTYAST